MKRIFFILFLFIKVTFMNPGLIHSNVIDVKSRLNLELKDTNQEKCLILTYALIVSIKNTKN